MTSTEVKRAEANLRKNTAEFETAVAHLEAKVEDTAQKLEQAKETALRSKEDIQSFVRKARARTKSYANTVRENPGISIAGAVVLIAAVGLVFYVSRRQPMLDLSLMTEAA